LFLQLKDDLTEKNFINFLLEDRRRLLSELGSVQLHDLTGRYRFDDAGEFNIVDELDADKVRDVGTLSGGEMFLASLALALGLAEAVAQEGGRLQCFFLDEGFGALDPESLDLALDGIERIVHPDRLIGLVSHVAGLAARVEDKIELEKGADGMTLVKDGASL
jgi:exonuclease SbcC